MNNVTFLRTPAVEAYVIALMYCDTRMTCLSGSAPCPWTSTDTVGRLLGAGLSSLRTAIVSLRLWTDQSRRLSCARRHGLATMGSRRGGWCGRLSGVLLGMQVVLLIWTEGKWKAPIGGRGGPSKIE